MKKGNICIVVMIMLFCTSCYYQQGYVQRDALHAKSRLAAVLPLTNLTSYPYAGRIVGDILTTSLYAQGGFRIMERTDMLAKLNPENEDLDTVMDRAVALQVGKDLGVNTVIFGSVTEFRYKRGLDEDPAVGINLSMLDVETNEIIWTGSRAETGGCFWFCEDSLTRLAQKVCRDLVATINVK